MKHELKVLYMMNVYKRNYKDVTLVETILFIIDIQYIMIQFVLLLTAISIKIINFPPTFLKPKLTLGIETVYFK